MTHVGFARKPSHHRGILYADSLEPLVLHGCAVDVEFHDFTARVQCTYEYKHLANRTANVFVALPQIPQWRLASVKTESNGRKVDTHIGNGDVRGQSHYHMQSVPSSETFVASVITQAIPWSLSIHDIISTTAVYVIPLRPGALSADTVSLRLPKALFPELVELPQSALEYAMQFPARNVPRLPRAYSVNFRGKLLEAAAAVPTISCGSLRSNGTVNGTNKNSVTARLEFDASTHRVAHDVVIQATMLVSPTEPLQLRIVKEFTVAGGGAKDATAAADEVNPHMYAGCASVVPLFNSEQLASGANVELVFLVDGSSSMQLHWAAVLRALRVSLHSLPATTYVNMIRYTGDLDWAYPQGAELFTEAVRANLLDEWMPRVLGAPVADGNPAKLYRALQAIYAQPYITGFARCVVLITDSGAEANLAHRALEVVRANTHSTRFSALGLGPHADVGFLQLIAEEGHGVFRHVLSTAAKADGEQQQQQLANGASSQLAAIVKEIHVPTLVHVTATARYDDVRSDEGPPVHLCTMRPVLPCIPQNSRSVFHLFAHSSIAPAFTLSVHGLVGMHQLSYKTQSPDLRTLQQASAREVGKSETVSLAHAGAAIDRVERLLSGSGAASAPTAKDIQEVQRLSASFLVPSPYVPNVSAITSRSGAPVISADEAPLSASAVLTSRYLSPSLVLKYKLEHADRGVLPRDATGLDAADADKTARFAAVEASKQRESGPIEAFLKGEIVQEIVRLVTSNGDVEDVLLSQSLDGSFPATSKLFSGIGVTSSFASERLPAGTELNTWSTALATAFLETHGPRPLVTLAVEKAKLLFKKTAVPDSLLASASRVLAH